jgi:hypothetical protein
LFNIQLGLPGSVKVIACAQISSRMMKMCGGAKKEKEPAPETA